MKIDLITIGNSRGFRIPKALLEQCGFSDAAEIEVQDQKLVIRPVHPARAGWEQAFAAMSLEQDDVLLDPGTTSAFDDTEWEWKA